MQNFHVKAWEKRTVLEVGILLIFKREEVMEFHLRTLHNGYYAVPIYDNGNAEFNPLIHITCAYG